MTQNDQNSFLGDLKKDLAQRPNDRAITSIVARYIHTINECMDYGYSRKDIYELIFSEKDKEIISLKYFNDSVLYRARKKFNSKSAITTNRSVNNQNSEQKHIEQNNLNSVNAFSSLAKKEQKPIHNSSSDQESANERLKQLLMQKRNEA